MMERSKCMNVPNIRFKGFNGEWEKKKLGEVAPLKGGYAFNSANFKDSGIPIVRISNILEYEEVGGEFVFYDKIKNEKQFLLRYEDIVIAMSGATTGKIALVKTKNKLYQNQRVGKFSRTSNVDYKYLSALVSSSNFSSELNKLLSSSAQPNASSSDIDSIKLYFPSCKQEQSLLGSFWEKINNIIVTTNLKLTFLKQIKAASLQSMFPQEGETVPKVRFKGFEGEWEKEKLSKLLVERHEISTITDKLPQLSFTISEGIIYPDDRKSNKRDFLIKDIVNKKYLITYVGDIIYNPANVIYGAIHRNSLCNGVVSPIYKIFSTEQDSNFMECIVRNPTFISQLSMKTEGTVTKLKTLKPESFLEMIVKIAPSIKEQQKIASYFCNLDKQISLQTQRLEKLKQIKAACLDKMFV